MDYQPMSVRERLVCRVNNGARDAYGITRREDGTRFLLVQRRWLPIMKIVAALDDGEKRYLWTEKDLPYDCAMADTYDETRKEFTVELSLFECGESGKEIITSDCSKLKGTILVIAEQKAGYGSEPFAVSAVFDRGKGVSSLISDGDMDLIRYMAVATTLSADTVLCE